MHIPGFAALSANERLQASALALNRDLSVSAGSLKLSAIKAPGANDDALIAYCTVADAGAPLRQNLSTRLFGAMQTGVVYWVNAPAGYLVGEHGATAVEMETAKGAGLPSVVTAMIAMAGSSPIRCVLVDRDRAVISDDTVAHWSAASGAAMVDGALPDTTAVDLVSPPRIRETRDATHLDRALQWSAIASVACAVLAAVQFASVPGSGPALGTVDGKRAQSTAGALLSRITTVAPEVVMQLQTGTYASGAWVLAMPDSLDPSIMVRMTRALETNGLAAQSTTGPSPRLRVQLP